MSGTIIIEDGSETLAEEAASQYQFSERALTPRGTEPFIKEILANAKGKQLDRQTIIRRVDDMHVARGGKRMGSKLTETKVKKGLDNLLEVRAIQRHGDGYYSCAASVSAPELADAGADRADHESESDSEIEDTNELKLTIKPEREIGEGAEQLYVYFSEAERKLANFEKRDSWPCKIGQTKATLESRLSGQAPGTAMYAPPIFGLVIRTDHSRTIEKILHNALRLVGQEIRGPLGKEWFCTNPDAVLAWYLAFEKSLPLLGAVPTTSQNAASSDDTLASTGEEN